MIVSFVFDPEMFSNHSFDDEQARQNLNAFLTGVVSNGVLLDTPSMDASKSVTAKMQALAGHAKAQRATILWTEIAKNKSKYLVTCRDQDWPASAALGLAARCDNLARLLEADAIICTAQVAELLRTHRVGNSELVPLGAYLDSAAEERRKRFESPDKPFDMCAEDERRGMILGAVKYAIRLVMFDGMIGEGSRLSHFSKGIEYIVRIWLAGRVRCSNGNCELQIVTRASRGSDGIPGQGLEQACAKIEARLCRPLSQKVGVAVSLQVKERSEKFHARHLECRGRAFYFDRGFDLFLKAGPSGNDVARNFVRPDHAGELHLRDIRLLRTLYPAS